MKTLKLNRFPVLKNQNAFSLVEMMIAIGVISIALMGVTAMLVNSMKVQKGVELSSELQSTLTEIRMNLSNPAICAQNISNFQSQNFDSSQLGTLAGDYPNYSVSKLQNGSNIIIQNLGSLPNRSGTKVTLGLTAIRAMVPGSSYIANLSVLLNKDSGLTKSVVGAQEVVRTLPIALQTTGSGSSMTIIGCSMFESTLASNDMQRICEMTGGTWAASGCTPRSATTARTPSSGGAAGNGTCPPLDLSTTTGRRLGAFCKVDAGFPTQAGKSVAYDSSGVRNPLMDGYCLSEAPGPGTCLNGAWSSPPAANDSGGGPGVAE